MPATRFTLAPVWPAALMVSQSACATRPKIPAPTVPVPKSRQVSQPDGLTAPSQKAWQWDAGRWFTAELDHICRGPIHGTDTRTSDTCGRSLVLPPWSAMMDKQEVLAFYAWYEAMKAAHPGWADAETDQFIARHRNRYRDVLNPDATTPSR